MNIRSFSLALIAISILGLTALTGCAAKTPEETVVGFITEIQDGHYSRAAKYMSKRLQGEIGDATSKLDEFGAPPNPDEEFEITADIFDSDISNSTAKVWFKDMPFMKWVLVKESGLWKIDNVDIDTHEMLKYVGGDLLDGIEIP